MATGEYLVPPSTLVRAAALPPSRRSDAVVEAVSAEDGRVALVRADFLPPPRQAPYDLLRVQTSATRWKRGVGWVMIALGLALAATSAAMIVDGRRRAVDDCRFNHEWVCSLTGGVEWLAGAGLIANTAIHLLIGGLLVGTARDRPQEMPPTDYWRRQILSDSPIRR